MAALSADDRFEIQDLYARYAFHYDRGEAAEWSGLFTPDGSFGRAGEEPVRGRAELERFVVENLSANPGVTHHTSNVLAEPNGPDRARGEAYALVIRVDEEGAVRLRNVGAYEDELVRTEDGWRFAARVFTSGLPTESIDSLLVESPRLRFRTSAGARGSRQ